MEGTLPDLPGLICWMFYMFRNERVSLVVEFFFKSMFFLSALAVALSVLLLVLCGYLICLALDGPLKMQGSLAGMGESALYGTIEMFDAIFKLF
jgi:hypothetical protein